MKQITMLAVVAMFAMGMAVTSASAHEGEHMNPCNPCSMKHKMNPCGMKGKVNPCSMKDHQSKM